MRPGGDGAHRRPADEAQTPLMTRPTLRLVAVGLAVNHDAALFTVASVTLMG